MISIAQTREKRRRVGIDSRFRVYGAPFDEAKIDRFLKRNNLSAEDFLDVPSPTDGELFLCGFLWIVIDVGSSSFSGFQCIYTSASFTKPFCRISPAFK
jgi:hypothetical protein